MNIRNFNIPTQSTNISLHENEKQFCNITGKSKNNFLTHKVDMTL